jgi:hypothetical protein
MWRLPNPVILKAAIDIIRAFVVCVNIVKLPYGRRIVLDPMGPTVVGHINPPVVPIDHMVLVCRVYPDMVVV